MKRAIKDLARYLRSKARIIAMSRPRFENIQDEIAFGERQTMLEPLFSGERREAVAALRASQSQLGQDIFVLERLGWKRGGFFVEFGATDGRTLSNSWLLEKQFGWKGILAEPGRVWRKQLEQSGRSAALEFDCVWNRTGEVLTFAETSFAELSTIGDFSGRGDHNRLGARTYEVRTIALNDMLEKHGAPAEMDYLSIDTEGSELTILESLDFARFRFRVITVEHNFMPDRERIHALLTSHGYERQAEAQSQYDDWYVLAS